MQLRTLIGLLLLLALACPPAGPGWADSCSPKALEPLEALPGRENTRTVTVAQAEALYTVEIEKDGRKVRLPFGHLNDRWKAMKAALRKGDALVEFVSSEESWRDLAGRSGVRLVRSGRTIDTIITRMN